MCTLTRAICKYTNMLKSHIILYSERKFFNPAHIVHFISNIVSVYNFFCNREFLILKFPLLCLFECIQCLTLDWMDCSKKVKEIKLFFSIIFISVFLQLVSPLFWFLLCLFPSKLSIFLPYFYCYFNVFFSFFLYHFNMLLL